MWRTQARPEKGFCSLPSALKIRIIQLALLTWFVSIVFPNPVSCEAYQHIPIQSDVTEITKGEFNDFTFKIHGNKHGFQAPTKAQRDGWLVAIQATSTEAKATRETLIASEGYKAQIEKLGISQSKTPIFRLLA